MRLVQITRRRMDRHGCRIVNEFALRVVEGVPAENWPLEGPERITLSGGPALDERPRAESWEPGYDARYARRIAQ